MSVGTNIRRLRKAKKMTILELATMVGSDVGNVSRLERGVQGYSQETLSKIASALGATVGDLFASEEANVTELLTRGRVPLLSWNTVSAWDPSRATWQPDEASEWLTCPAPHGGRTYAVRASGDAMDGPGGYREDEILFVDPDVTPKPGKDVIAILATGRATFRRLKEDDQGQYLLAINPTWPDRIVRVPANTQFCGVVIGSFMLR